MLFIQDCESEKVHLAMAEFNPSLHLEVKIYPPRDQYIIIDMFHPISSELAFTVDKL